MVKKIETERLILRAPKMSDSKDFYQYAKKPNIGLTAGWLPHEFEEESRFILSDFIKKEDVWVITIKPSDKMVGSIGLKVRDFEEAINGICELGYALDDTYWNKGYVSEATKALIEYAFKVYEVKKIIAGHSLGNIGSQKIILKNNFKFTHIDTSRTFANPSIKEVYMYELVNPKEKTK